MQCTVGLVADQFGKPGSASLLPPIPFLRVKTLALAWDLNSSSMSGKSKKHKAKLCTES